MFPVLLLTLSQTPPPEAPPPRLVGERVELRTPTGTLFGTLDLPQGRGPWPAVLLHPGSGPTDRDGNQPNLRSDTLALLGRGLAAKGVAVLRIDKRGIAASAKAASKEADLRFKTYVDDAAAWLLWLRADGRFTRVGAVGHSEGALIVTLAAKAGRAEAVVALCGAGRPAGDVLREQLAKSLPAKLKAESDAVLAELEAGREVKEVPAALAALYRPSVQPYLISWLRLDPAAALAAAGVPARIVDGGTDIQIAPADGDRLAELAPAASRVTLAGMNHVLRDCPSTARLDQLKTYLDPSLPLHPGVVDAVADFLRAELRAK